MYKKYSNYRRIIHEFSLIKYYNYNYLNNERHKPIINVLNIYVYDFISRLLTKLTIKQYRFIAQNIFIGVLVFEIILM